MKDKRIKLVLEIAIPILVALLSVFVVAKYATLPETYEGTIAALDEKRATVMELTAASTAASVAISLLPGDAATPIAEKLTDMSTWFLLVLCAIYLEKYLLTIMGAAAFYVLVPIACALLLVAVLRRDGAWRLLAFKFILFALILVLVIPAGVFVSDHIEATYEASITETIAQTKELTDSLEEEVPTEEKKTGLAALISSATEAVTGAVTEKIEEAKGMLNNLIESLAVMLVTSCVIPLAVLAFFLWLIRAILGVDIKPQRRLQDNN